MIDSETGDVDLRNIRVSQNQLDIQSYVRLLKKHKGKSDIKKALIKMVRTGLKPDNVVYTKIEQFIEYVKQDKLTENKVQSIPEKNKGTQLIRGFYYVDGQKYLSVDLDDMEQCQQLIKEFRREVMTYEEIQQKRKELGDKDFRIFLGY
jgi:hypothetical protein